MTTLLASLLALTPSQPDDYDHGMLAKLRAAERAGERRRLEGVSAADCGAFSSNPQDMYSPVNGPVYQIRTVFHVITNGPARSGTPGYISQECLKSQIDMVNRDYRHAAATSPGVPGNVHVSGPGTDTKIELVLEAIEYYDNSTWWDHPLDPVKGYSSDPTGTPELFYERTWDTEKYLNIWTKEPRNGVVGSTLNGCATTASRTGTGATPPHTPAVHSQPRAPPPPDPPRPQTLSHSLIHPSTPTVQTRACPSTSTTIRQTSTAS